MEVRPGYKLTEVGIIPEDWIAQPLGALGSFKNGINKAAEDFGHGSPFINLMDVFGIPRAAATTENLGLVNSTSVEQQTYELRAGDVLFVRSSVKPEGVGLTTLIPDDLPTTVFSGFLIRFRDHGQLAKEFKEHCFLSDGFRRRLIANSTVSANTNINQDALKQLQLGFPPRHEEQRAIAAALSDADVLLGGLDRLIAKKRYLKQAAMQQLLTGQTRLPGFHAKDGFRRSSVGLIPEDWRCLRVPQVVSGNSNSIKIGPFGSALKKEFLVATGYKVYGQENLYAKDMALGARYISHARFMELRACEIRTGDFLISMMGTVGKCLVAPEGIEAGIMDSHLLRLRLAPEVMDAAFLTHVFETPVVLRQVKQLSVGGIMEGLSSKIIRGIALPVPSVPEQTAIAAVLSDMDAELSVLEARREKTRDLKQAMMQELLTGKTRLVPAGATHA